MVGGQVLDLAAEEETPDAEHIYTLQDLKTGALIRAACCCGVVAGHGSAAQYEAAARYATALGLAFQIRDDMLERRSARPSMWTRRRGRLCGSTVSNAAAR